MVNAAEMTRAISDATQIDESSVAWTVRVLREAGLLTSGGRGRNSAKMKPQDAAYVLVAMLCSDRPADAVRAIKDAHQFGFAYVARVADSQPSRYKFTGKVNEEGYPEFFLDAVTFVIGEMANLESGSVDSMVDIVFKDLLTFKIELIDREITYRYIGGQEDDYYDEESALRSHRKGRMGISRTWSYYTIDQISKIFSE